MAGQVEAGRTVSLDLAVIVPVLGRPQNAAKIAASLEAATSVAYRLVFVCSPGDHDQIAACHSTGEDVIEADWHPGPGDFARKVNIAYEDTSEPWLFQAADDVVFHAGWDVNALACAEHGGALVVGTYDGHNPEVRAGRHSTHTLIARSYCDSPGASMDGPGTVFSEAYGHQFCDTELVGLARERGVWAFAASSHVIHEHPFWVGRDRMDATYAKGLATSKEDAQLYRTRQKLWRGVRSRPDSKVTPATRERPGA